MTQTPTAPQFDTPGHPDYYSFPDVNGHIIDLGNPAPEMFSMTAIAAGLSKVCRFNGQIPCFYSVAQHSVIVSRLALPELRPAALIHDASEAYIGDMIKPLKKLIAKAYGPIEKAIETAIFDRFGLEILDLPLVKPYDLEAYRAESGRFRRREVIEWYALNARINLPGDCWEPARAEELFLTEARLYFSF
jgi:hypothetical protein